MNIKIVWHNYYTIVACIFQEVNCFLFIHMKISEQSEEIHLHFA